MPVAKKTSPTIRDVDNPYERDNARLMRDIFATPLVQGRLLKSQAISVAGTRVNHRLGRPVTGFFVVGRTSATEPYQSTSEPNTAEYFTLLADEACTVSLWVF